MDIVFISNFLTPHQIPLCRELYHLLGRGFCFIETIERSDNIPIGWKAEMEDYPFLVSAAEFQVRKTELTEWINTASVVVIGSAPDYLIRNRLKLRKLTFKYSERFYKKGINLRTLPRILVGTWLHHGRYQNYPLFMLCASAYTSADGALFHNYLNKCYKWGYFPEYKRYHSIDELQASKNQRLILWVGRLIDWKHPETAVELANLLKKTGEDFAIRVIGEGEEASHLKKLITQRGVEDHISCVGAMPPNEVRLNMENAGILICTSDYQEGWGAIVNEAMNSGCAVVASHAVGSAPFLIDNGKNGYIYENGNIEDLANIVKELINNPFKQKEIGQAAYQTITDVWNHQIAARRLIDLCQNLLDGNGDIELYKNGPCSKADIIQNDWIRSERI